MLGQSNIANYGATYKPLVYTGLYSYNICDRTVTLYQSPIRCDNATGSCSTMLPMLGDRIAKHLGYDKVIFNNLAVGGSSIENWSYNELENINALDYYDLILWHQGETDTLIGTTSEQYTSWFQQVKQNLRNRNITAPIVMAKASYAYGLTSESVIEAQSFLIAEYDDIIEGPNTDVIGIEFRYDDIHFNRSGLVLHCDMWFDKLEKILKKELK